MQQVGTERGTYVPVSKRLADLFFAGASNIDRAMEKRATECSLTPCSYCEAESAGQPASRSTSRSVDYGFARPRSPKCARARAQRRRSWILGVVGIGVMTKWRVGLVRRRAALSLIGQSNGVRCEEETRLSIFWAKRGNVNINLCTFCCFTAESCRRREGRGERGRGSGVVLSCL